MFAEVAVPVPLRRTFHYTIPDGLASRLVPGMRVAVQFVPRQLIAYFLRTVEHSDVPAERLKPLLRIVDPVSLIPPAMLRLTEWIATYYFCSWGEALDAVLPGAVRRGGRRRRQCRVRLGIPVEAARAAALKLSLKPSTLARARVLEHLLASEGEAPAPEIRQRAHVTDTPIRTLEKEGLLVFEWHEAEADPFFDLQIKKTAPLSPTPDQALALKQVRALLERGEYASVLIHGVTGSGKTEVYLQAIADVIAAGKQAIVLVPEIALTPQTVARFRSRFEHVAVLHSHLTEAQRFAQWQGIQRGTAQVVVGARSAVFAPTPRLGLIVVDEEHEPSFKQQNVPRYHARDVAVLRAREEKAVALLGSATPSLESYQNARGGKYSLVELPARVEGRPLPPVEIVDMGTQFKPGKLPPVLSRPLALALRAARDAGEQAILFLNRRGYATLVFCPRCQFFVKCGHCDVAATYHKQLIRAVCHHCFRDLPKPDRCPECGYAPVQMIGLGTERVEEELKAVLAGEEGDAPRKSPAVARMDSDAMRSHKAYRRVLEGLWAGDIDVLVGTQMVAKGLDFPNVTLVGVVSGDTCLYLRDFRAAERTFQLLTQVAGRAGRGPRGGRVIVQTFNAGHYSIQAAAKHDYRTFAEQELKFRELLGYPPFGRILRVLVHGRRQELVEQRLKAITDKLRQGLPSKDAEVMGPAPAPLTRLKDRFRWHSLLKARRWEVIRDRVEALGPLAVPRGGVHVDLDMDPVGLL